jgi:hypothetical protein
MEMGHAALGEKERINMEGWKSTKEEMPSEGALCWILEPSVMCDGTQNSVNMARLITKDIQYKFSIDLSSYRRPPIAGEEKMSKNVFYIRRHLDGIACYLMDSNEKLVEAIISNEDLNARLCEEMARYSAYPFELLANMINENQDAKTLASQYIVNVFFGIIKEKSEINRNAKYWKKLGKDEHVAHEFFHTYWMCVEIPQASQHVNIQDEIWKEKIEAETVNSAA